MSCTSAIEARIENGNSTEEWKQSTTNDINGLASAGVLSQDQLSQLRTLENDIFSMVDCARQKINTVKASPTNVSSLQEQIVSLQKEVSLKEDQYEVAKQRAQSIYAPEQKTTDYEGWFPLGRSIQPTSLFILIGFSIFFTLFFFGMLMSFLGFDIQLSWAVPRFQTPGARPAIPTQGWMALLLSWINPLTLAAFAALLITSGFLIWMGTK